MPGSEIGRRQFLQAAGLAAVALGTTAVGGCSSGGSEPEGIEASSSSWAVRGSGLAQSSQSATPPSLSTGKKAAALPSQLPFSVPGVKPDLPGNPAIGLLDGFFEYPASRPEVVEGPVWQGEGGLSVMMRTDLKLPTPMNKNKWWQAVNKRLGVTVNLQLVLPDQYRAKSAAVIAGNSLPDAMQLSRAGSSNNPPHLDKILKADFEELSPYVSGEAVKEYPLLANLPTAAWRAVRFNGGIYGVPYPLYRVGAVMMCRQDVFDDLSLSNEPTSADDFLNLCQALTDPGKNRYAMMGRNTNFFLEMFGAPNNWSNVDGKFASAYVTTQYKDAIAYMAKLWAAGVCHPDSFSSAANVKGWFGNKAISMYYGNYSADGGLLRTYGEAGLRIGRIRPPRASGGGWADTFASTGLNSFLAIKKTSADRVHNILRVANYFAAPFGTAERLLGASGIEGVDYTWTSDGPVATDVGKAEGGLFTYIAHCPWYLFYAGNKDETQGNYDYQEAVLPTAVDDPTVGLISETMLDKGGALTKRMNDITNDIIQGRKKISALDDAVKAYLSGGGNAMKAEYENAYSDIQ